MGTQHEVLHLLREVLEPGSPGALSGRDSRLLGVLPELDSTSVVTVITAIEERFDIDVSAEEIDASVFATVGSLADFVSHKLSHSAAES